MTRADYRRSAKAKAKEGKIDNNVGLLKAISTMSEAGYDTSREDVGDTALYGLNNDGINLSERSKKYMSDVGSSMLDKGAKPGTQLAAYLNEEQTEILFIAVPINGNILVVFDEDFITMDSQTAKEGMEAIQNVGHRTLFFKTFKGWK